jgi:CheY-like chemotaxis protein
MKGRQPGHSGKLLDARTIREVVLNVLSDPLERAGRQAAAVVGGLGPPLCGAFIGNALLDGSCRRLDQRTRKGMRTLREGRVETGYIQDRNEGAIGIQDRCAGAAETDVPCPEMLGAMDRHGPVLGDGRTDPVGSLGILRPDAAFVDPPPLELGRIRWSGAVVDRHPVAVAQENDVSRLAHDLVEAVEFLRGTMDQAIERLSPILQLPARQDLRWLSSRGIQAVSCEASLPGRRQVKLTSMRCAAIDDRINAIDMPRTQDCPLGAGHDRDHPSTLGYVRLATVAPQLSWEPLSGNAIWLWLHARRWSRHVAETQRTGAGGAWFGPLARRATTLTISPRKDSLAVKSALGASEVASCTPFQFRSGASGTDHKGSKSILLLASSYQSRNLDRRKVAFPKSQRIIGMHCDQTLFCDLTSRLRGVRVLVVEDTWVVADAVQSLLEDVGMIVAGPAASVADAERLVGERTPQMAVVDVNLKGELALGLIRRLRRAGVGVVVISGFPVGSDLSGFGAASVQKPFSGPELLGSLCSVLASPAR